MTPKQPLVLIALLLGACADGTEAQPWPEAFGYAAASLHQVEIRDFGFPHVVVAVGEDTLWLPFDTGNMVGLTLESRVFHDLDLPCSGETVRRDSAGRQVFAGCVAHGVSASVFGVELDSVSIFEFSHERLPGLVGPDMIPGTRFTLDYRSGRLGADGGTSAPAGGFESIPLVRSPEHPRLILIRGRVQDREVLIEVDTGKSRTTVDRELVEALGLTETSDGAHVGLVEFGPRSAMIPSARVVQTSGISGGLPAPISLGIGSDVLAEFVFTVDYESGEMWVEDSSAGAS